MKQSPGIFSHSGHVRIHSGRVALALISDMAGRHPGGELEIAGRTGLDVCLLTFTNYPQLASKMPDHCVSVPLILAASGCYIKRTYVSGAPENTPPLEVGRKTSTLTCGSVSLFFA